jgi:cbb3-type cytochrome oxidase subunit 3
MKFSRCPVFTVKSVGLVAIGLVVVGATYFVYNKMTTSSKKEENQQ